MDHGRDAILRGGSGARLPLARRQGDDGGGDRRGVPDCQRRGEGRVAGPSEADRSAEGTGKEGERTSAVSRQAADGRRDRDARCPPVLGGQEVGGQEVGWREKGLDTALDTASAEGG